MAGKEPKMATVIIKVVDLGCDSCAKKIKRALCKLQERFKINSIVFDEKKNTVTVSGAFNPDCFIKKIRCMACKVIICIEIKPEEEPKPKPAPEVKVNFSICCCRPCPCYQPHLGCNRCCFCGHLFSCPPSQPSCSGGYPCYKIVCEDEPSYGCSIM